MPDLHMLLCTTEDAFVSLKAGSRQEQPVAWIVPKDSKLSDQALFYLQGTGLVGTGVLRETPRLETSGKWAGRYRALVGDIRLLAPVISETTLLEALPTWKWLTYPRMYTTPPQGVAAMLRLLLSEAQRARPSKKRGA